LFKLCFELIQYIPLLNKTSHLVKLICLTTEGCILILILVLKVLIW